MKDYRKYFPIYKSNPKLVYLDSSATSLKPQKVIDAIVNYYTNVSANTHRAEYKLSTLADMEYMDLKKNLSKFLNGSSWEEFIINSGATSGLNQIFYGIEDFTNKDDEIITDIYEHSSMILPIFRLANLKKLKIKYIKNKPSKITWKNIKPLISSKTKIVAINHVSNLTGYINDIYEIGKNLKSKYPHIIYILDLTQSIPHIKIDIEKTKCDFAVFSAHKIFGPTGIGALYIKTKWIEKIKIFTIGGSMFTKINVDKQTFIPNMSTYKFEAGTLNIAGIYGFNAAIKFLLEIGYENIFKHEQELKKYLLEKLVNLDNIEIINPDADLAIIVFNHKKLFCQDLSTHLSLNNICVRAGQHCVKLSYIGTKVINSVRVSLSIYNNKKDIDCLIDNLKKVGDGLDAFF